MRTNPLADTPQGTGAIVLAADGTEAVVHPAHGAVISAIRDGSGPNILWLREGGSLAPIKGRLGPSGVASIETFDLAILAGGWFPMFPTVGPTHTTGTWMHGQAARVGWSVTDCSATEVRMTTTTPDRGFRLSRTVSVSAGRVAIHMTLHNPGPAVDVAFGEHPCFRRDVFAGAEIRFPEGTTAETTSLAEPGSATLPAHSQFAWARNAPGRLQASDVARVPQTADGRHDHVIATPPRGRADVAGAAQSIRLNWDRSSLPHALVWQHYRPPASPWHGDVFAIEPMSTGSRTHEESLRASQLTHLRRGQSLSYTMTLEFTAREPGAT